MPRERRSNVRRANVTACTRCRNRKQRCDQKIPACSNCERAGLECVSMDIDGGVVPRRYHSISLLVLYSIHTNDYGSYVKSLEDRVAFLELQLSSNGISDVGTHSPSLFEPSDMNPSPSLTAPYDADEASDDLVDQIATSSLQPQPFTSGMVNHNGLALLRSLLSDPMARVSGAEVRSDSHFLLDELPPETLPSIPRREAVDKLVDIYFEHCNFFSPILESKDEFIQTIEPLYNQASPDQPLANAHFRALVVLGTSILLLNRVDFSVPASKSDSYFTAAMRIFAQNPETICTGDLNHLANLLFIIQYCCFASNITAAWHFIGLATRLAIELGLHKQQNTIPCDNDANGKRWLFWSLYTFERNLCVVIGRPFSIPDGSIRTPLPVASAEDGDTILAIHLLRQRILESEIFQTLNERQSPRGAIFDKALWRENIHQRLQEWFSSVPQIQKSTHLAPAGIFSGAFNNNLVFLYYPSNLFPTPTAKDLTILARSAIEAVKCYERSFRAGELRFFWRTIHNLFRSGVAIAYCAQPQLISEIPGLELEDVKGSLKTCSSVLWGMVERYPPGRAYRDVFDKVSNSVLNQQRGCSEEYSSHFDLRPEAQPTFDDLWSDPYTNLLPSSAFDTLVWGLGEPPK